jgi:hypothetical protein
MFTAEVIPAGLFFFLLFLVPETPRWLTKNGNEDAAFKVLARIDGAQYAGLEMTAIRETLQVRKGRLKGELEYGSRHTRDLQPAGLVLTLTIPLMRGCAMIQLAKTL